MIKCDICGRSFKNKAGLAGHKKINHGAATRKTIPDEIGKRLEALEKGFNMLAKAWGTTTKQLTKNDNRILDTVGKLAEEIIRGFRALT